jgi:hypothetical protein
MKSQAVHFLLNSRAVSNKSRHAGELLRQVHREFEALHFGLISSEIALQEKDEKRENQILLVYIEA